jgi:uncharacterized damage-inducible protein DinB
MLPLDRPPATGDERTMLVAFLESQRALLLWKLRNLDEDQAHRPMVDSGTSLLGLVKHLAWVERWWFVDYIGGAELDYPWSEDDPDADWRIEEGESIESISQLFVDAVAEANAVIAATPDLYQLGHKGKKRRSLRWVLLHMIEETARHLGHADILRELADGVTGYLPPSD